MFWRKRQTAKDSKRDAARSKVAPEGAAASAAADQGRGTFAHHALLMFPMITEKSALVSGQQDRAVFRIPMDATKEQVKSAVEALFNVKVANVRTCRLSGKPKRVGRFDGRRAALKKAYVTLQEGFTLNVVEGV